MGAHALYKGSIEYVLAAKWHQLCIACSVGAIVGGNFQYGCQPASVGELWYDKFMRDLILNECKDDCKHVKVRRVAYDALRVLARCLVPRSVPNMPLHPLFLSCWKETPVQMRGNRLLGNSTCRHGSSRGVCLIASLHYAISIAARLSMEAAWLTRLLRCRSCPSLR